MGMGGTVMRTRNKPRGVISDTINFLRLWFRRPRSMGAIAPSSRGLSRAIASEINFTKPGVVVELGGGTGVITRALVESAVDPGDIVVIEREASLCRLLRARYPDIRVIRGDARNLGNLLRRNGIDDVTGIVSGLPLLSMPKRTRREIVDESLSVLPADGLFVQFTYGLAAPLPREVVEENGMAARRSGWVFRNLPPAAVWLYKRENAVFPVETRDISQPLQEGAS